EAFGVECDGAVDPAFIFWAPGRGRAGRRLRADFQVGGGTKSDRGVIVDNMDGENSLGEDTIFTCAFGLNGRIHPLVRFDAHADDLPLAGGVGESMNEYHGRKKILGDRGVVEL